MAYWVVAVPGERYQGERLYQHDLLAVPVPPGSAIGTGDEVVLVAPDAGPDGAVVFGLGRVAEPPHPAGRVPDEPDDADAAGGPVTLAVAYTHRLVDAPLPVARVGCAVEAAKAVDGPVPVTGADYARLADRLGPAPSPVAPRPEWMVSLALPIEAATPAEAVRLFWTYVRQLGPRELPAFVWPRGDELAMRPYVLGAEHEMDPEEEDE